MKKFNKALAILAAATMAASMGALVGCGEPKAEKLGPEITGDVAAKILAVYSFNDLAVNEDGELSTTVKATDAAGMTIQGHDGVISTNMSEIAKDSKEGVAWNANLGYMTIPGVAVTAETGVTLSAWINSNGTVASDWNILASWTELDIHTGCLSVWDSERMYMGNYFEGMGGEFTENITKYTAAGSEWQFIVAPVAADWTFVTITANTDGTLSYYINGDLIITKTADALSNANDDGYQSKISEVVDKAIRGFASGMTIAGSPAGEGSIGWLDDVIISTALSADEVVALYNATK